MLFLYPASWDSSQALGDASLWPLLLSGAALGVLGALWSFRGAAAPCTNAAGASLALTLLVSLSVLGLPRAYAVSEWWGSVARLSVYAGIVWAAGRLFAQGRITYAHLAAFGAGTALVLACSVFLDWKEVGVLNAWKDPYGAPGLLGHKNFTASALLLGFWGALYAIQVPTSSRNWRIFAGTAAVLAALALALLRTRSIWLGLALGGLFWLWNSNTSWKATLRRAAWPLGVFLIVVVAAVLQPSIQKAVFNPQNLRIRAVYWGHSWQMLAENPWTGVGAGQWGIRFPGYGLDGMDPLVSEGITAEVRPHNDFLWIASEFGWPGLGAFLALWLFVLYYAYRAPRGTEKAYLVALLTGVFVYSLFEFPLERAAVSIPWVLGIAALGQLSGPGRKFAWMPKWATGILALALLLPAAYVVEQRRAGTEQNAAVLAANARQNAKEILQTSTAAFTPWNEIDRYGNPLPYFQGMGALFVEAQQTNDPTFAQAEAYFRTALALHPNHLLSYNQLGNLSKYRGKPAEALPHYLEALKRSRDFGSARLGLAECLLDLNRTDSAGRVLFESFGVSTNGTTQEVRKDPRYRVAVQRWVAQAATAPIRYRPLVPVAGRLYESPESGFAAFEAAKDAALIREQAKVRAQR
jgi:O-antigen ligase